MEMKIRSDSVEVSGYVNAVGRESRPLRDAEGYFTETMEPGVFARALARGGTCPMLLNHDEKRVMATGDGDLLLREDNVGLFARATVTDPEVVDMARRGLLRGWSFGFLPISQRAEERGGMRHRTVSEIDLREVSIIDNRMRPAYEATSVFTRAEGEERALEYRTMEFQDVSVVEDGPKEPPDLGRYESAIKALRAVTH